MRSKKELNGEFEKKHPQEAKQFTPIRDFPVMVEATKKHNKLKQKLSAINEDIYNLGSSKAADASADAERLIAGKKLEARGISRQELIREKDAIEGAIKLQEVAMSTIERDLIKAGVEKLLPIAQQCAEDTISAFENAERILLEKEEFLNWLARLGYRSNYLPAPWRMFQFENTLFSGGNNTALYVYLDQLRKSWGVESKGKKHKF